MGIGKIYYKLVNKKPVKMSSDEFLRNPGVFDIENRTVQKTKFGDVNILTVFLAIDHSFGGDEPVLFETMIFGGPLNDWQERAKTWDEAVQTHNKAVGLVKARCMWR